MRDEVAVLGPGFGDLEVLARARPVGEEALPVLLGRVAEDAAWAERSETRWLPGQLR